MSEQVIQEKEFYPQIPQMIADLRSNFSTSSLQYKRLVVNLRKSAQSAD